MEQAYWLGRKRAAMEMAQGAASAEARLAHYDLAGRYSLKAMSAGAAGMLLAEILPPPLYARRGNRADFDHG